MKLAYILLWFPKASETFIFREVVNLAKLGADIRVFTLYGELFRELCPEMREVDIPVERLGLGHLRLLCREWNYWRNKNPRGLKRLARLGLRSWGSFEKAGESLWALACAPYLARRCLEQGITHIHSPWACGPGSAAWAASILSGIPFSFTGRSHDIFPPDTAVGEKLRDAAFARCETEFNKRHLAALYPEQAGKLVVTYNGLPLTPGPAAQAPMRAPLKLLALGRLVPTKGFTYLLRACAILKRQGLDFRLTIAGSGPRGPWLKLQAGLLGLNGDIEFPGFVEHDQTPKLFAASDIFIMPSQVVSDGNRDGLPTVILEALAHGLPVVATDVSGLGEIIIDNQTGLLVPQKDPQALAEAITRLARDRAWALRLAQAGQTRLNELFDPARNHRRVLELFERAGSGA